MKFQYTINDIKEKTNVSLQSLYALIKKNKAFIGENSMRRQRKIYYNQAVMDFFVSYYAPSSADSIESQGQNNERGAEASNTEKSPLESPVTGQPPVSQENALKAEITALKAEIATLKEQLNAKEEERKELIRQNGALILTLQQEKQEKQLFLPAPKKTIGEKLKAIFKK